MQPWCAGHTVIDHVGWGADQTRVLSCIHNTQEECFPHLKGMVSIQLQQKKPLTLQSGAVGWVGSERRMCCAGLSRLSRVRPCVTPWTVAPLQAPLSMGSSRQECWSGLPCLPPGDLPDPGIALVSSVSCTRSELFITSVTWESPGCARFLMALASMGWV